MYVKFKPRPGDPVLARLILHCCAYCRNCWIKIDSAESWRDAELGVRAMCAVGDTTDEDRWVDLRCCSPHCDIAESCLTNDTLITLSSSWFCYDDWRRPSPTVWRLFYDASSSFRRCSLLRSCHDTSAALRLLLAVSYVFLVTFSVLYCYRLFFPCFTS